MVLTPLRRPKSLATLGITEGVRINPAFERRIKMLREIIRPDLVYSVQNCPYTPEGYEEALKIITDLETASLRDICDHYGDKCAVQDLLVPTGANKKEANENAPQQSRPISQSKNQQNVLVKRAEGQFEQLTKLVIERNKLPIQARDQELRWWLPKTWDLKIAIQALTVVQRLRLDWPGRIVTPMPADTKRVRQASNKTMLRQPKVRPAMEVEPKQHVQNQGEVMGEKLRCFLCLHPTHKATWCHMTRILDASQIKEKATKARMCYSCLEGQHQSTKCKQRKPCVVEGCKKNHHPLIHGALHPKK
jgi:hypothetical protein